MVATAADERELDCGVLKTNTRRREHASIDFRAADVGCSEPARDNRSGSKDRRGHRTIGEETLVAGNSLIDRERGALERAGSIEALTEQPEAAGGIIGHVGDDIA